MWNKCATESVLNRSLRFYTRRREHKIKKYKSDLISENAHYACQNTYVLRLKRSSRENFFFPLSNFHPELSLLIRTTPRREPQFQSTDFTGLCYHLDLTEKNNDRKKKQTRKQRTTTQSQNLGVFMLFVFFQLSTKSWVPGRSSYEPNKKLSKMQEWETCKLSKLIFLYHLKKISR